MRLIFKFPFDIYFQPFQENHVGNTSGKIRGRRYFSCHLTKGRFVPLHELILHSDFDTRRPTINNAPSSLIRLLPSAETSKCGGGAAIICVICQDPLLNPEP